MKRLFVLFLSICLLFVLFVPNADAISVRIGDMDSDYLITAADARIVLRAVVGLENLSGNSTLLRSADANGNGSLEAEDARLVLRAAVGLMSIPFVFENNSEYWSGYRDEGLLKAYYSEIAAITRYAGKGRISDQSGMASLTGVSVVRLIDFDGDGRPELYCAFSTDPSVMFSNRQEIIGYEGNGMVKTLYSGEITNNGSDYSPLVWFLEKDDQITLVTGMLFDRGYYRLVNGEFKGDTFVTDWDYFDYTYVNGKRMNSGSADAIEKQYTEGAVNCKIWLFEYGEDQMRQYNKVLAETDRVIALLRG